MIRISHLYKSYGNGPEDLVLQDISLEIRQGEIFGIIGQSGVGKSTLLRCINGLEDFDGGALEVKGTDISRLKGQEKRQFRKSIGMIFQNFALLNRKSVLENVMLPMRCWKYPPEAMRSRALELLNLVGLGEKTEAYPAELSGGQKQRVAIARALTLNPEILLCDEATSSLDPAITRSILDLLEDINRELGITIVIVTHEMDVVRHICDRMAIVTGGRVAAEGPVEDIFLGRPPALTELTGEKELPQSPGYATVRIQIRHENLHEPVLYRLTRETGIPFSVVSADIGKFRRQSFGSLYLSVPEVQLKPFLTAARAMGLACGEAVTAGKGETSDVF